MPAEGTARKSKSREGRTKGPLQRHPYLVLFGAGIVLVLVLLLIIQFFVPILLLTSIIALACYWKTFDVTKRAVGVAAIAIVALLWILLSGEKADVTFVREEGRLPQFPHDSIGKVVEQYMWRTRWKAMTEGDHHYVQVTGRAKYRDKDNVQVVLRFHVKRKENYVRTESLYIDDSRLSALDRANFVATVFRAYRPE